jgi:hypothetical protein
MPRIPRADLEYSATVSPPSSFVYPPPRCTCALGEVCAPCQAVAPTPARSLDYARLEARQATPRRQRTLIHAKTRVRDAVAQWVAMHHQLFTFRELETAPQAGLTVNIVYAVYARLDDLWADCLAEGIITPRLLAAHKRRIRETRALANARGGKHRATTLRATKHGR